MKTTFGAVLTLVAMVGFVLSVCWFSSAKAEDTDKPAKETEQVVIGLDKADAKTCDEPGACVMMTPSVVKDLMKRLHSCAELKDFKKS